jgi:diguanylate cyclase (GGDEF)-like protein/PAS domain S-box-containing protein
LTRGSPPGLLDPVRLSERLARAAQGRGLSIAATAYGATFVLWLLFGGGSENIRSLVANLGYLPIGGVAGLMAWRISRMADLPRRQQMAWGFLALGCALTWVADAWWALDENVRGLDPAESWANVPYLLYYVAILAGLLLLPEALRNRRDAVKFTLDAATVMVGGGMAVWYFVLSPGGADSSQSRFASIVSLCYPLADMLLLLGVAGVLMRCPRGPRRHPLVMLAAAMAAMMVADVVWANLSSSGDFEAGQIQDIPYMAQYVLFTMAVAEERRRLKRHGGDDPDPAVGGVAGLPYVAVVTGYTLMLVVSWEQMTPELMPLVAASVILTVLVLVRQIVAVRENIRLQSERTVLATEKRFRSLIQHASDIVSIVDTHWTITFVSPSAVKTLGYQVSSLVGKSILDFVHDLDVADATARLRELLIDPQHVITGRWRLRRHDGTWIQTDSICTNLVGDPDIGGLVITTRDVSDRVLLENQLVHQAFHDPLTGLANRALFHDRVQHALDRRHDVSDALAVLFIDLDQFKAVNDGFGHAFGDDLLKVAAKRLVACLRPSDTAARLGGDEFAVLIDDVGRAEDIVALAGRIAAAFLDPFKLSGREVVTSASVGVAFGESAVSAEEWLRNADLAMYLAKGRGGAQTAMYDPAMYATALNRLELQNDLRHALERGELSLVYQPIHMLESRVLVGAEALLRWTHPSRGPVPPSVFVPIAEETGLIVPIGRWVIREACAAAAGWQRLGHRPPLRISVNLSSRQIPEASLVEDVTAALRDAALPAKNLVLELTESVLLQHTDQALSVMNQLKAQGIRLAIDDFGTGYSSLSYLQRLPIDILKIDRAFVERIEEDKDAAAVTRAIIALGETMSLRIVAEGIENASQAEHLRKLGCHLGQGYFYGRPMAAAELEAYASKGHLINAA